MSNRRTPQIHSTRRARKLRRLEGFREVHPVDAYHYLLHLCGTSDPDFNCEENAAVVIHGEEGYVGTDASISWADRRRLTKDLRVISAKIQELALKRGGRIPTLNAARHDILRTSEGTYFYHDFLYPVLFESELGNAWAFYREITSLFSDCFNIAFGQDPYAALQLVAKSAVAGGCVDPALVDEDQACETAPLRRFISAAV